MPAYWLVASDGGIFSFGGAPFYGSTGCIALNKPIVGMAGTPDGGGYWLVASDGGIFTYGDAGFYGSTGSIALNKPVVGMASTPDGKGYWLVASDGGIFAYGDAQFYGWTGSMALNKPVVGMASTPDGKGYWLVASDGGIFAYGDAAFYGSTGSIVLNQPIIGMMPGPGGAGYFLVASDGGMFSYGDTQFYGSLGGLPDQAPDRGGRGHAERQRLLDDRLHGTGVELRLRQLLRLGTEPAEQTDRGHGGGAGKRELRRRHLSLGRLRVRHQQLPVHELPERGSPDRHRPGGRGVGHDTRAVPQQPCLPQEMAWAGGGLNLYIYLTYGTSTTNQPGCNGDTSCNAGYQAGMYAYGDAQADGAGPPPFRGGSTWRPQTRTGRATSPRTRSSSREPSTRSMRPKASPMSASTPAPACGTPSSATTNPSVPYWMADYLAIAQRTGLVRRLLQLGEQPRRQLPGPPEIVQYNSQHYDEDYAC